MNQSRNQLLKLPQAKKLWLHGVRTARHCAAAVLDTLYPLLCVHCSTPLPRTQRWLCLRCQTHLIHNATTRKPCLLCGMSPQRGRCACDRGWDHVYESVWAVYTFDAVVRSTVHEIKYKGKSRLAFTLMQAAAASIPAGVVEHIDALIPVPLHKSRMRKRGYNQAQMLAEGLCAGLGGHPPVWDTLVRRTRKTKTQTRMNHEQRQKNMRTVFTLTDTAVLSDKHLLIVDDVVTTGATAGALAEVLLRGGAASINVLCLARD